MGHSYLGAHPLRFGVMCTASGLSDFARRCIGHITQDGLAEPALLILDESPARPGSIGTRIKKSLLLDGNLWALQSKLFPLSRIPAYRLGPLPTDVPRIACKTERKGKWSEYFTPADVATIRSHDLDFILKFAFGIVRGEILEAARYGVWSYHHGDEEKYRGGPPAFWEIYQGDPVTAALLQRLTDRLDGGIVLKKCYVPTNGLSHRKNLQQIQQSSWHMARWVCLDVRMGRADYLRSLPSQTKAPISRAPRDLQMLRFWARLVGNWFRYKLTNQRTDEWNVGLVRKPQSAWLDPAFKPEIEWSPYHESGQMVADPYLIPSAEERPRALVEEFNWSTERGRISEMRWPEALGQTCTITPLIDEGLHMSYPFIVEHEGAVYAIPECSESNSIPLYRLDPESGTWRRERTLIDKVNAVDSTVLKHGDTWWLIHSGDKGWGRWSLYLWHAPSLFGPWEPHVANPVKTDVGGTRPAGNFFWHQGNLYRPAQDGRTGYGGALCINRVDELSKEAFRETVVRRIQPDPNGPYPDGIHTLSGFGERSMVDGKKNRRPPVMVVRRFLAKRLKWKHRDFAYSAVRLARPAAVPLDPASTVSSRG